MAGWPVFQKITPLSPEAWAEIHQCICEDTWVPYQEEVVSEDLLDRSRRTPIFDDEYEGYSFID